MTLVAVRDRMFLGMQDLDFCPNLIIFYPIYSNFHKFYPNLPKVCPNWPKFCPNLPKKFIGVVASSSASPAPTPLVTLTIFLHLYVLMTTEALQIGKPEFSTPYDSHQP